MSRFESGKLPQAVLAGLLRRVPRGDPHVLRPAAVGEDAAVIDTGGERLLVAKSDPVTFATDRPGWYAVQVNANDVAAMGAECRWFLATLLLPENLTDTALVDSVFNDILKACRELGVELVGGHTEITHGLGRVVVCGQMLGQVEPERLCSKERIAPGDSLLLAGALAVEGTALIAREHPDRLRGSFPEETISRAAGFLYNPGISVVAAARAAAGSGRVHAMHDPTEGGLAGALAELAAACHCGVELELSAVPILPETEQFCAHLGLDPLGLIASGALLIACAEQDVAEVLKAVEGAGTACREVGRFLPEGGGLHELDSGRRAPLRTFSRDEFARL